MKCIDNKIKTELSVIEQQFGKRPGYLESLIKPIVESGHCQHLVLRSLKNYLVVGEPLETQVVSIQNYLNNPPESC